MQPARSRFKPKPSASQRGFTLSETLVALFILSLAATLLGQFVRLSMASEARTTNAIQASRAVGLALRDGAQIKLENGETVSLNPVKPTQTADCLYDVVGRRCR